MKTASLGNEPSKLQGPYKAMESGNSKRQHKQHHLGKKNMQLSSNGFDHSSNTTLEQDTLEFGTAWEKKVERKKRAGSEMSQKLYRLGITNRERQI